jgi:hypothetical protein
MTFACHQAGLQGLPVRALPVQSGRLHGPAFYTFISPSECDSSQAGPVGPTLLSAISTSSHGIRVRPPADILRSRPPRHTRGPDFGDPPPRLIACSVPAVSHHLDGFLREQAVSLLRLTSGQRFAAFPSSTSPLAAETASVDGFPSSPQRVSHPSKDSPRPQPHRVTTAVAFLTFHSLRALPRSSPKSRLTSRHQLPHSPKSPRCPRSPRPKSRFAPTKPCHSRDRDRSRIPVLVLLASEEATPPICMQIVAWCISTADSEESALDTSPIGLRRVLPNVVHSPLHREAEVPEDRGASISEEIDLPLDRCFPSRKRCPNSLQTRVARSRVPTPKMLRRTEVRHHINGFLLGAPRTEIPLAPRSFATTLEEPAASDCLSPPAFRRRRRRSMEPSGRPKPAIAQPSTRLPKQPRILPSPHPTTEAVA